MVSFIPDETTGSDELYTLCKIVAHSEARKYILNKEQIDRMWVMSRELFLDTVVYRQHLTIISECANKCSRSLMSAMYPSTKMILTPTMTAAFGYGNCNLKTLQVKNFGPPDLRDSLTSLYTSLPCLGSTSPYNWRREICALAISFGR